MIFNKHSGLEGKHAILSPSKPFWLNDDDEAFAKRMRSQYATEIGTLLHDIARKHIQHGFKMNKADKRAVILDLVDAGIPSRVIDSLDFDAMFENLATYTNDAIGFKMQPEVLLYYTLNCYGTADAIQYYNKQHLLRIHDYKSGTAPVHMEQLLIYAGLFCLEYKIKPKDIDIELRIYWNNQVLHDEPDVTDMTPVIETIVMRDKFMNEMFGREGL